MIERVMGTIHALPQHLINRLKAGEIVERPASVVKELIENSLDAGATQIAIEIEQGGKQLIKITDNGHGISKEDLPLTIERYATSKITTEKDLHTIASYGFRGEALATISEVSGFRLQSKTTDTVAGIGYELSKMGGEIKIKEIPVALEQGTIIYISDIFHAIPAREKFLKSDSTEWRYIKKLVIDYAIVQRDKQRSLSHKGKQIFFLAPAESLLERVLDLTQSDREQKFSSLEIQDEQLHIYGLVGDASLHFPKGDRVHIFVNGRPVEDRLVKRAIMDAYSRQIVPGTYPFAIVFIDIDPALVDVNVHPRKQQVKFLDPGSMFQRIKSSIQEVIGSRQVNYAAFTQKEVRESPGYVHRSFASSKHHGLSGSQMTGLQSMKSNYGAGHQQSLDLQESSLIVGKTLGAQTIDLVLDQESVQIVGQIWDSYILLQGVQYAYRVDQHALAERISFEQMRTAVKENGFETELLLQPLTLAIPHIVESDVLIEKLNKIGFDVSLFGEHKIIIHAVPTVFATYKVDIELVMQFVFGERGVGQDDLGDDEYADHHFFGIILDEILGMKACKASIKAGQRLSMLEMQQLMNDGVTYIDGLFVCQHGRPSIVKVERGMIDALFDR